MADIACGASFIVFIAFFFFNVEFKNYINSQTAFWNAKAESIRAEFECTSSCSCGCNKNLSDDIQNEVSE